MRFDLNDKKCWAPFLDEKRRPVFFPAKKVQNDRKWQVNAPELKYAPAAGREEVRRLE